MTINRVNINNITVRLQFINEYLLCMGLLVQPPIPPTVRHFYVCYFLPLYNCIQRSLFRVVWRSIIVAFVVSNITYENHICSEYQLGPEPATTCSRVTTSQSVYFIFKIITVANEKGTADRLNTFWTPALLCFFGCLYYAMVFVTFNSHFI